jgi:hypothetical protein
MACMLRTIQNFLSGAFTTRLEAIHHPGLVPWVTDPPCRPSRACNSENICTGEHSTHAHVGHQEQGIRYLGLASPSLQCSRTAIWCARHATQCPGQPNRYQQLPLNISATAAGKDTSEGGNAAYAIIILPGTFSRSLRCCCAPLRRQGHL